MKPETELLLDLMIHRALHGLDEAEQDQLDQLLLTLDAAEIERLERELETALAVAGSASALAATEQRQQAPPGDEAPAAAPSAALIATLEADADRFFGVAGPSAHEPAAGSSTTVTSLDARRAEAREAARGRDSTGGTPAGASRPAPGIFAWTGWAVAALLLATVWVGRPAPTPDTMPVPTVAEARASLLDAEGTVQTPWGDSTWAEFAEVQGDVVWNDQRQEGYLRLANMPANDPATAQYQLWIVDPARDEEPVDGGVFDIPPGAREVVVPIRAKLAVRSPAAFAITREQPGGVVVSEGPLLVVASRG